jgi:PAS domain S-box-containing protein
MTGTRAGEIAARIANGARPHDIPVENAPLAPIFDWRELRRWGISEDLLPPGSVVRFKELSIWDQYRWQIIGVISLCLVEAFLIFALLAQRARRSRAEEGLRLSEERFSKAFHASPEPISIYRYRDNVILEVNERWTAVYGYTREEAVGHTALALKLVEPEDREKLRRLLEKQRSIREYEVDFKTKRGEIRHVSLSAEQIVINNEFCIIFLHRDITERKRAEEALKESQRRLEEAQRIAHVGHWERDLDTGCIIWSDEIYRIFGLPPWEKDLPLSEWLQFLHPEDRERVALAIEEAQRGIRRFDVEYRIVRPDGEVRYIHSHGDVIRDEQGRARRLFGVGQDITERKRAEEALRESQQQYETLVNTIDGIVWEIEAETFRFTFVSKQAERILGYPVSQWHSEPNFWTNHLYPDDRDWAVAFCADAGRRRVDHQLEYRMLAADGRVVWLSDHVTVNVRDDNSVCLRGVMVDITERKLAGEALRKSENLWRTIFDNAAIGIAIVNPDGRPVETNPAFQKILGYTKEELLGLWFVDFTHPDDLVKELSFHQEMIDGTRDHYQMEKRYIRKDGQVRWVNLTASVIPAEQPGEFFGVGMVEDITERKQAEEQLKTSSVQLRALSESLRRAKEEEGTRIARELHDELGASLTSLKWSLLRLDEVYSGNGNPAGKSSPREKIAEMVGLVDTTINTVRRISSELRPGGLDDLGLVSAIEWHAEQFQEHTGIVCRFDSLIEHVELNREQATTVFRIYQEAMTNVLRHAQATKVNIIIEEDENEFVLEIKDNGRGITESERLRIDSLGLLGMRERAHSLNGKVEISGSAGKGTVLILRLPINGDAT